MKNALLVFAAGCLGALIQIIAMNVAAHFGLMHHLGVQLSASYYPYWLYPRVVWGGLWGFVFLLPIFAGNILMRSLLLSLIPACVQLFVWYPFYESKGIAGFSLGLLTPVVIVFLWWIWALSTSLTLKYAR